MGETYTVYMKVRYNIDMFFMVGNQFGFHYSSEYSLTELYNDLNIKLDEYLSSYNLSDEDIIYLQISFRLLSKKLFNHLRLIESDNMKLSEVNRLKSIIYIPAFKSVEDIKSLGQCLPVHLDSDNKINSIELNVNGIKINFLDKILDKSSVLRKSHSDLSNVIDNSYNFVYIKSRIDYILAVKQLDPKSIEILKYSTSGVFISKTLDNFSENCVTRKKVGEQVFINDRNEVSKSILDMK